MNKQILILGIVTLFIFLGFSGCFGNESISDDSKFIGTWNHGTLPSGRRIFFTSDGNCNYLGDNAKWELKDEKLEINFIDFENELIFEYKFLDDNQLLELTNTETGIVDDYIKQ